MRRQSTARPVSAGLRSTDPSCIYDAATQRFFIVVLTLETAPGRRRSLSPSTISTLRSARRRIPTGAWNIYQIDVTNDGTNTGGVNPGPYLGDYPHIGADANGFYLTTNAYPWCCNGFAGAQIYAFSKAQLAAGAASVTWCTSTPREWSTRQAMPARRSPASPCGRRSRRARVQHRQRWNRVLHELERRR